MKKLTYSITINKPAEFVFHKIMDKDIRGAFKDFAGNMWSVGTQDS